MSPKVQEALRIIRASLKENEPKVRLEFAKAGIKPDPTLVFVFSIYYDTLSKLARE